MSGPVRSWPGRLVRAAAAVAVVGAFGVPPALADAPPPVANNDSYETAVNTTLNVAAPGVLANDTNYTSVNQDTSGTNGTAALDSTGAFTYVPNTGFHGVDTFTYHVLHGSTPSPPATVTITVNAPPVVDTVTIDPSAPTTNDTLTASYTAHDDDGDTLTPSYEWLDNDTPITGETGSTLALSVAGNGDKGDVITVRVTVSDGTASASLTSAGLTIGDSAPVAVADGPYAVQGGTTLDAKPAQGVLGNDSDPDADPVTAVLDTGAARGALTLNQDGSFTYAPDPGVCNRSDGFTYHATDGELPSGSAAVAIAVQTPRSPTTLTLHRSATEVVYGHSILLTAHLSAFSPSAVVSIYGTPAGGRPTLLKPPGHPDAGGELSVRFEPTRRTSFEARSTDNCYLADRTSAKVVEVSPRVDGHMVGSFDRRGEYALYHAGGRVPRYHGTVIPDHAGSPVTFVWQRLAGGSWKTYLAQKTHLNDSSAIDVYMKLGVVKRVRYRVRIVVPADKTHLAGVSPWAYFVAV